MGAFDIRNVSLPAERLVDNLKNLWIVDLVGNIGRVAFQIVRCLTQNLGSILKLSESMIATDTEQGANATAFVAMVYKETFRLVADGAFTLLCG